MVLSVVTITDLNEPHQKKNTANDFKEKTRSTNYKQINYRTLNSTD